MRSNAVLINFFDRALSQSPMYRQKYVVNKFFTNSVSRDRPTRLQENKEILIFNNNCDGLI